MSHSIWTQVKKHLSVYQPSIETQIYNATYSIWIRCWDRIKICIQVASKSIWFEYNIKWYGPIQGISDPTCRKFHARITEDLGFGQWVADNNIMLTGKGTFQCTGLLWIHSSGLIYCNSASRLKKLKETSSIIQNKGINILAIYLEVPKMVCQNWSLIPSWISNIQQL